MYRSCDFQHIWLELFESGSQQTPADKKDVKSSPPFLKNSQVSQICIGSTFKNSYSRNLLKISDNNSLFGTIGIFENLFQKVPAASGYFRL